MILLILSWLKFNISWVDSTITEVQATVMKSPQCAGSLLDPVFDSRGLEQRACAASERTAAAARRPSTRLRGVLSLIIARGYAGMSATRSRR